MTYRCSKCDKGFETPEQLNFHSIEKQQESNRLVSLRQINHSDILITWKLHREYQDYLLTLGIEQSPTTYEHHEKFVLDFLTLNTHPFKEWYIVLLGNTIIGYIVLKKSGEFGYVILRQYQNNGFGKAMFKEFFKLHPKTTVWARTKPQNIRSQHMLTKTGFQLTDLEYHYMTDTHINRC